MSIRFRRGSFAERKLPAIFDELVNAAIEIAEQGDVP